jgi:hypothetical protein
MMTDNRGGDFLDGPSNLIERLSAYADPQYRKELLGKGSLDNIITDLLDDAGEAAAALTAAEAENARLRAAGRAALNYIENTEGELGITLSSGDALRAALSPPEASAPEPKESSRCPRCVEWERMGLSNTCPSCDYDATSLRTPAVPAGERK